MITQPACDHTDCRTLDRIERIFVEDEVYIDLRQCPHCQQLFVWCFIEIDFYDNDDLWIFWLPVTEKDADRVREDYRITHELIDHRPHYMCLNGNHGQWVERPPLVIDEAIIKYVWTEHSYQEWLKWKQRMLESK